MGHLMQTGKPVCSPGRLPGRRGRGVSLLTALHPGLGVHLAADRLVELEDEGGKAAVVTTVAETVDGGGDGWIVCERGISVFQDIIEDAVTEDLHFIVLADAEVRGQAARGSVAAQDGGAEGVHRRNLGEVDARELALEVAVFRVFGKALGEGGGDFGAQLGGSGIRIGDDEEVIDVRALPADFTQESVDEHLGFAGTGGGGDQKRPAFVFNDCLLMGGQCDRHRGASFPVRSRIAPA